MGASCCHGLAPFFAPGCSTVLRYLKRLCDKRNLQLLQTDSQASTTTICSGHDHRSTSFSSFVGRGAMLCRIGAKTSSCSKFVWVSWCETLGTRSSSFTANCPHCFNSCGYHRHDDKKPIATFRNIGVRFTASHYQFCGFMVAPLHCMSESVRTTHPEQGGITRNRCRLTWVIFLRRWRNTVK